MFKPVNLAKVIVFTLFAAVALAAIPQVAAAQTGQLYLVSGTSPDDIFPETPAKAAIFLENIIVPSLEILAKDKRVVAGGLPTAQRRFSMIVTADSPQEVADMLHALPFWPMLTWDVTPLESFQSRADKEKATVARLKTMK